MLRVIIDLDGVVYDWQGAFLNLYREWTGEEPPAGCESDWDFADKLPNRAVVNQIERGSRLWTDGNPYPGAIEAAKRLFDTTDAYIATQPGRHVETAVTGKAWWLAQRMPWLDQERVIYIKPKWLLRADVLIDDRPRNVRKWLQHNPEGVAYLVAQPWNCTSEGIKVSAHAGVVTVESLAQAAHHMSLPGTVAI
jgi:5'-nucleotidase